jgi:hypothetical protein
MPGFAERYDCSIFEDDWCGAEKNMFLRNYK